MAINIPREPRSLSSWQLNNSGVDGILLHQGEEFRLRVREFSMRSECDNLTKVSIEAVTDASPSEVVRVREAIVISRISNVDGFQCFSTMENDVEIERSPRYFGGSITGVFPRLPARIYEVQGLSDRIQFPKASSIPEICRDCKNLHGQAYTGKQGTNMLICAMHPSGAEGDECSDRKEAPAEDAIEAFNTTSRETARRLGHELLQSLCQGQSNPPRHYVNCDDEEEDCDSDSEDGRSIAIGGEVSISSPEPYDTGIFRQTINQYLEEVAGVFGHYTIEIMPGGVLPGGVWEFQPYQETEGDREEEED